MRNIPFCTPSKNQKTFVVFWCFQEGSNGNVSLEVDDEPELPSSLFLDFLFKYLLLSDSRMGLYTDLLSSFICDKNIQEWAKWNLWKTAFKKFKWYDLFKNTLSHMFGDRSLILNHTPNLQWFVRTFSSLFWLSDYQWSRCRSANLLWSCLFYPFIATISYVMFCAIWCHLYNLKSVKNTHGGVLLLVKMQAFSLQLY